jgi:hypothetical protein
MSIGGLSLEVLSFKHRYSSRLYGKSSAPLGSALIRTQNGITLSDPHDRKARSGPESFSGPGPNPNHDVVGSTSDLPTDISRPKRLSSFQREVLTTDSIRVQAESGYLFSWFQLHTRQLRRWTIRRERTVPTVLCILGQKSRIFRSVITLLADQDDMARL